MAETASSNSRLSKLLEKRGQDLVKGIVAEFEVLQREVMGLRREVGALVAYQASRERWLQIGKGEQAGVVLPRSAVVDADQMLQFQDGFYQVEYTSKGVPFRWTGPSPYFSFEVFIDRSRGAELTLDILSSIDFDAQKDISLFTDGVKTPVKLVAGDPGFSITAVLPARIGGAGTNLLFVLPTTLKPGAGEERALGVAFTRLALSGGADATSAGEAIAQPGEPAPAKAAAEESMLPEKA